MKPNEGFNEVQLHLLAMSALLREPKAWTRGAFAQERFGFDCSPSGQNAVRWCLLGAMERTSDGKDCYRACRYLEQAIGEGSIPSWNDDPHRTHTEVQEALLRAVVLAGGWAPA